MTAFAAAVNAIFSDPHMALDAEYRAGGAGDPVSVRVVKRAPDAMSEFNAGRYARETLFLDIRVSDVADLNPGDTLTIDSEVFTVTGEPLRDSERLVWQAEARS